MKNPTATSDFPKVGTDGPEVVDTSGAPSQNTTAVPRQNDVAGVPSGPPPGHRTQVEVNAQSSQRYGEATANRTLRVWGDVLSGPDEREYLRNVLGVDAADDQ